MAQGWAHDKEKKSVKYILLLSSLLKHKYSLTLQDYHLISEQSHTDLVDCSIRKIISALKFCTRSLCCDHFYPYMTHMCPFLALLL